VSKRGQRYEKTCCESGYCPGCGLAMEIKKKHGSETCSRCGEEVQRGGLIIRRRVAQGLEAAYLGIEGYCGNCGEQVTIGDGKEQTTCGYCRATVTRDDIETSHRKATRISESFAQAHVA